MEHTRLSSTGFGTQQSRMVMGFSIFFIILATLAVIGRFVSRWMKSVKCAVDDWLMLGGLIFYYASASLNMAMTVVGGVGYHIDNLSESNISTLFKIFTIVQFPYGMAMTLIRCSICMLLVRIFFQVTKTYKYVVYAIVLLSISWCAFVFIAAAILCRPFEYNWDTTIKDGKCGNRDKIYVWMAVWAIICDVCIWAVPFPVVWKLQLVPKQKLALSAVFAMGLLDIITSIFRIVDLLQISFTAASDISFGVVNADIWSVAEPSIAILVGCGPVLRPVLEKLSPTRLLIWTTSSSPSTRAAEAARPENYGRLDEDQFELVKIKLGRDGTSKLSVTGHNKSPVDSFYGAMA